MAALPTPLLICNQGVKLGKNPRNSSVCIISWCSTLCHYNKYCQATLVPLVFRICGCNHTYLCVTSVGIFTRWHCLYLYISFKLYIRTLCTVRLYISTIDLFFWGLFPAAANIVLRIPAHTVRYPQIYISCSFHSIAGGPQPESVVINNTLKQGLEKVLSSC